MISRSVCLIVFAALWLGACVVTDDIPRVQPPAEYFGTLEPFASEAVYFIVTDRFVDGDPKNNFPDQGGVELGTFDRPIRLTGSQPANIGYLGGDFQGVMNNAGYIADMGFTALWLTPVVDNPDEAFTGGISPGEGFGADRGKTGYHGYWGVNFFEVDEHLESPGLTFEDFTHRLRHDHKLGFVLDVVCNHGSPSYSMPADQPMYGELYDADGKLVADHENLDPKNLDPDNPLHALYHREPDLAQLSNMNDENVEVLEYFVDAYLRLLDQGVMAFRIDTIKHMPHAFWKSFSDRIRKQRPGLFMFAESYSYDASRIAMHTYPENGAISVLDFPGRESIDAVFANGGPFSAVTGHLHLDSGVYQNPYELMTFYDNHDMPRMDAGADGFIDAHNWMFTSRGIPVVYYGSEIGFRAGAPEHGGNRDYFGQENIEIAKSHPIRNALSRIAAIRKNSVALQRGLQLNLQFDENTAAFLRVYQKDGERETVLVLLNKADETTGFEIGDWLFPGPWRSAVDNETLTIDSASTPRRVTVPAHGVNIYVTDAVIADEDLISELQRLQMRAARQSGVRTARGAHDQARVHQL